jgi:hypothetical protein
MGPVSIRKIRKTSRKRFEIFAAKSDSGGVRLRAWHFDIWLVGFEGRCAANRPTRSGDTVPNSLGFAPRREPCQDFDTLRFALP